MPSTNAQLGAIKFPEPDYLTLSNFKRGVITLIDKSRTPQNALIQADNLFLVEDGQPAIRPGVNFYGSQAPNAKPIDGFDTFDLNGQIHLVIVAGGTIYRSLNDGITWDLCTGGTMTAGYQTGTNQNNTALYLTNGIDNIVLYTGTTTLTTYTALATPAAPTAVVTNGGTGFTSYYKVSAVNAIGFSMASLKVTVQNGVSRGNYNATTNYVTLSLPAYQPTQTRTDIYYSTDDITYAYLDSVTTPNQTYKDDGSAIPVYSTQAPTGNTTQGPKYAELVNIGVRQYGLRDPSNRYRVGFSGAGSFSGAFSSAYDGGYIDIQPGGKYYPVKAADYRDGKGSPIATVWCDSADGEGAIFQLSLDTVTVGDISVTQPSIYKLPGSRGTPAPGSVINVLDDYLFYNSQAFYDLGNKVNLQQIISTAEISANIRPTIKQISTSAEAGICSAYFDAKVYWSVPYGSSQNNATIVYDTEQKAWLPYAFTIGFKKFLKYTDTKKNHRLLCLRPGDNQLSEISNSIQGDYGVPFVTNLVTGLYPVNKNRFEFQFTEEMEYEFSNPQGTINVELIGIERTKGYGSVKIKTLNVDNITTTAGWDTGQWDTMPWDNAAAVPTVLSESSVKRYSAVQKELNAVQWHISTAALNSRYTLRTLQTWGTSTQSGHPASWRI